MRWSGARGLNPGRRQGTGGRGWVQKTAQPLTEPDVLPTCPEVKIPGLQLPLAVLPTPPLHGPSLHCPAHRPPSPRGPEPAKPPSTYQRDWAGPLTGPRSGARPPPLPQSAPPGRAADSGRKHRPAQGCVSHCHRPARPGPVQSCCVDRLRCHTGPSWQAVHEPGTEAEGCRAGGAGEGCGGIAQGRDGGPSRRDPGWAQATAPSGSSVLHGPSGSAETTAQGTASPFHSQGHKGQSRARPSPPMAWASVLGEGGLGHCPPAHAPRGQPDPGHLLALSAKTHPSKFQGI